MIKLYLDENVPEAIAIELRLRGYDIKTVKDAGRRGISDIEQLNYATTEGRVIVTFNTSDFCKIHPEMMKKGISHGGIIVSRQLPIGSIVRALAKLLSSTNREQFLNSIVWLSDWVSRK